MSLMKKWARATVLVALGFLSSLNAANYDGTSSAVFESNHAVLNNSESAQGFVRLNSGFTVPAGSTATFDVLFPVAGGIDLRDTGEIQLSRTLEFDAGVTLTSGGKIKGASKTIILHGDLTVPSSKTLRITGDTQIDGRGHTITLDEHAQFIVDSGITLTLRNAIVKNSKNNFFLPPIQLTSPTSALTLKDVQLDLADNFNFAQGKLYIHDDVVVSGTSAFVYHSTQPSFIARDSSLLFDFNSSFSHVPAHTATTNLIQLQDASSKFLFCGCCIVMSGANLQFSTGTFKCTDEVQTRRHTVQSLESLSTMTSHDYGTSIRVTAWSPNGKHLAVAGNDPVNGLGGFADTNEVRVYTLSGTDLDAADSKGYGTLVHGLAWSPDGKTLAVVGQGPGNGEGDFANTHEIRLYSFDGSTLTALTSQDYGTSVSTVAWSPNGDTLAVAGTGASNGAGGFANTDELRLYSFDGSTLTALTSQAYGASSVVRSIAWRPDGGYLVIGGNDPVNGAGGFANTNEIRVYSFDGSTLSAVTSQDYGTRVYTFNWSPDGNTLAVGGNGPSNGAGGFANTNELRVYSFDGSTLTALTSQDYGNSIHSVAWHPAGRILALGGYEPELDAGGFDNTYELRVYDFDGTDLSVTTSRDYGDGTSGSRVYSVSWSPDGKILATGGYLPHNENSGFENSDDLRVYLASMYNSNPPSNTRRVKHFGNPRSLGGTL